MTKEMAQKGVIEGKSTESLSNSSNVTCHVTFADLKDIEVRLVEECTHFHALEKEAAWRGLRIGLLILRAKAEITHGKFLPWLEKAVPEFTRQHSNRFMQLADAFLRKSKMTIEQALPLAGPKLLSPSEAKGKELAKPLQMAFDFLGNDSVNDLFKKYNIMNPRGGYHPPADGVRKPHDPTVEAANSWQEIGEMLTYHCITHKTWANLKNQDLCTIYDLIDLIHSQMREAVKRIKTPKK